VVRMVQTGKAEARGKAVAAARQAKAPVNPRQWTQPAPAGRMNRGHRVQRCSTVFGGGESEMVQCAKRQRCERQRAGRAGGSAVAVKVE